MNEHEGETEKSEPAAPNQPQEPKPKGDSPMEVGEFHNRDGWYFKRAADGSVRIQKRTPDAANTVEQTHIIPENEWASVVASVAARGEAAVYAAARALHMGELRRPSDIFVLLNVANAEERRADEAEARGDHGEAKVRRINAADLRDIEHRLV